VIAKSRIPFAKKRNNWNKKSNSVPYSSTMSSNNDSSSSSSSNSSSSSSSSSSKRLLSSANRSSANRSSAKGGAIKSSASLFDIMLQWKWVLLALVVAAVVLGWIAVNASTAQRRKRLRARILRTALDANPETVLVCLRAVRSDVAQVVQCVVRACEQASSPMRLRFAVVQEDTAEDVYLALEHVVVQSSSLFDDIDLLAHFRTMSVIRSNYMHAAGAWRSLYDGETVVVCVDAWIDWAPAWDVQLVKTMSRERANAVLSAPNDGQFCTITRESIRFDQVDHEFDYNMQEAGYNMQDAEYVQRQNAEYAAQRQDAEYAAQRQDAMDTNWPAVVGKAFAFDTGGNVTDALAIHHHFWALHGAHFASLPVPTVDRHVPLYLVDVVLSDWLFVSGKSRLRTLPHGIFSRPPPLRGADAHLARRVPVGWDGRLHLSAAFLAHAGLERTSFARSWSRRISYGRDSSSYGGTVGQEGPNEGGKGEGEGEGEEGGGGEVSGFESRLHSRNLAENSASAFVVTARAQLGLTPSAIRTDEGTIKYGSQHAAQQQQAAIEAAASLLASASGK
jgi:hypothetical protein